MSDWWRTYTRIAMTIVLTLTGLAVSRAMAGDRGETKKIKWVTPEADQAIDRGLAFLASRQHEDGSLGRGTFRGNVAIVALSGMAFLSGGNTPGRGPYGRQVASCLDYVLSNVQESGFITVPASSSPGAMYGHGFASLFLAECYGSSPRPELREKLAKAVKLIVDTQNTEGGWRYEPHRVPLADVSVTICEVMALRAARNAGFHVPSQTVDRATRYIRRCQNRDGGFSYMDSPHRTESAFGRSAAGLVGMYSAGIYDGPEIANSLNYLMRFLPQPPGTSKEPYFFYGHYYAALGMWQAGGDAWARWYPAVRDDLIKRQTDNGGWADTEVSFEYATAMACIVLQVPNDCLPIFQR